MFLMDGKEKGEKMQNNTIFKIISSLMILITILSVVNASTFSNSISTFTGNIDMGLKEIYNLTNLNSTNVYATNLWIGATKVNSSNLLPLACANNTVGKYDTATGTWLCQSETDPIFLNNNGSIWIAINNRALLTQLNTMNTSQFADNTTIKDSYIKTLDTNDNVTTIQVTGTGTKTLTLEQTGGNVNKTATWTDIDTDTTINVTSIQVTGTTSKIITLEQLNGIVNRTASFTDIDTDTVYNTTSIQVTGTTTKTLNLEQIGIANRTASWTDIDTDTTYSNGTGLNLTGTTFYLDLNYVDGAYVKRNAWTTIDNYPTGCSAGQYISTIGDTLTCSTPTDLNFNVSSIQFTGNGQKTLNLEQIGIANRTATFTDLDTVYNVTSAQFTGTTTKTLNIEQKGSSAISNITATFTDLTNSSADMIFAINNTNGIFTMQGLNMSIKNTNMNAQNTTYTIGSGGIILNQSQSHFSIQENSSGCVVIKGASSTLAVC